MPRGLRLLSVSVLTVIFSYPAAAQDSPSLGDIARQAQKNREKDRASKPAAKVLTNDDMPSGASSAGVTLGGGSASPVPSEANLTPAQQLDQLDSVVTRVAALDKAALVRNVLQEKSEVNFPGRAAWEQRLLAARDAYVAQNRAVIQKARQIVASADSLKGTPDPNDPRVKELAARLQNLTRDAVQTDAGLQAVVIEGRDLASQPGAH
jgi:hypothetical protein